MADESRKVDDAEEHERKVEGDSKILLGDADDDTNKGIYINIFFYSLIGKIAKKKSRIKFIIKRNKKKI